MTDDADEFAALDAEADVLEDGLGARRVALGEAVDGEEAVHGAYST
jgi:hypothetical protein